MSNSILKSDQPNTLSQPVPQDDPWGNQASNPHRMKSRMKKMQQRHLEQNNIVTKLEAKLETYRQHIVLIEDIIEEKDLEIKVLVQDLIISEGKVAAKAKSKKKASSSAPSKPTK